MPYILYICNEYICSINGGCDVLGTSVDKLCLRYKRSRKYVRSREWANRSNLSSDLCSGVYWWCVVILQHQQARPAQRTSGGR